ncbi:YihY/virulence factor BrkB family protein [Acidobacteriota bacterium]
MKFKKFQNLKTLYERFKNKNIFMLSAGVSFYAFLSLFPFFILILFISSLFFKDSQILDNIEKNIRIFPPAVAEIFKGNLESILESSEIISFISLFFLIYFAFKVFSGIELALNSLYGTTGIRKGWYGKIRAFISFLISVLLIFLLFLFSNVYLVLSSKLESLPFLKSYIFVVLGDLAVITFFFALSYRFLSFRKLKFKDALIGGFVAAVLWEILRNIYGLYISSIDRYFILYGTVGSIVFLLIWIYYSVLVFLLGAEISIGIKN